MKAKERDEFLIEQLEPNDLPHQIRMKAARLNLSSWEWFGYLYKKAEQTRWFNDLLHDYWSCPRPNKVFPYHFIDPERFANALYDFLSGKFPSPYLKNKEKGKYETES